MTLKMNSLLISIVVLTIFVLIIPAIGSVYDSDKTAYSTFVNDKIQYTDLKIFKEKYNEEILQFCKKNNIKDTNEEDIMSASLLYFKESFEEYIMYVTDLFKTSEKYIHYLLLLKDDTKDNEFKNNLELFKNKLQNEYTFFFENLTFFSLPKDIEEEYFSRKFRWFYWIAQASVDNLNQTVQQFIEKAENTDNQTEQQFIKKAENTVPEKEYEQFVRYYIEELKAFDSTLFPDEEIEKDRIGTTERRIAVNRFITSKTRFFENKWRFVNEQSHILKVRYLIHDKIQSKEMNPDEVVFISDDGDEHTIISVFLMYFKENEITDENNKKLFYKGMLRTMLSIYNAYIGKLLINNYY
ncbi:uncharacterized protein LOC126548949 isoform X2 [Aphis gossypii]|uniref:uncharacterized protein LOC126548949 isoform X2 n=1 Tax=Aphis gossypii TaxID=80765 RepID=UPI002158FEF3|nr:uncharacterized protein LOC126548949 isoform X2 [Aphis gossypii]